MLAAGLGLSVLGAAWLVSGAVDIARGLGISEAMIGLTFANHVLEERCTV